MSVNLTDRQVSARSIERPTARDKAPLAPGRTQGRPPRSGGTLDWLEKWQASAGAEHVELALHDAVRPALERARLGRAHPHEVTVLHLHGDAAVGDLATREVDRGDHAVGVELVDLVQLLEDRLPGDAVDATRLHLRVDRVAEREAGGPGVGPEAGDLVGTGVLHEVAGGGVRLLVGLAVEGQEERVDV